MTARRILVVEDEQNIRRTVAQMLRISGYEVTEAPDGNTAVTLAQSTTFDLVLSDIRLPGMDGCATMRAIRQLHPEMRGVAMTGYAGNTSREMIRDAGFRELLRKPFTFETLLNAVNAALADCAGEAR